MMPDATVYQVYEALSYYCIKCVRPEATSCEVYEALLSALPHSAYHEILKLLVYGS